MFGNWFRMFGNWFKGRRSDRQREIFRYWDGSQYRRCDPVDALIRLQSHPEYNYREHPDRVDQGDQNATEITCRAVRDAFGVQQFDENSGRGLTIRETLELLSVFVLYLESLKKSIESPVILPSATGPTSSVSEKPIMSDTSDSGPTVTAPNSGMPTASAVL